MQNINRRIKQVLAISIVLIICGLVTVYIGSPLISFVSDAEKFRMWVEQQGWFGRIAFLMMLCYN